MWTAASSVPNRELITPVARNSWKVSAGMRNRSSRNGTAALRLPKNVTRPESASCGIVGDGHDGIGEPAGKQHEADRQELAAVGEVERRRHDDVGQRRGVGRARRGVAAAPCSRRSATAAR